MSESEQAKQEFRKKVRTGYTYGVIAIFGFFFLLTTVPAVILGGGDFKMNGEPTSPLMFLLIMVVMLPIIAIIQGFIFSWLVTFGLCVKNKIQKH